MNVKKGYNYITLLNIHICIVADEVWWIRTKYPTLKIFNCALSTEFSYYLYFKIMIPEQENNMFDSNYKQFLIPREARLINLSGRAGPSGAKPREFERKIYLYIYMYVYIFS